MFACVQLLLEQLYIQVFWVKNKLLKGNTTKTHLLIFFEEWQVTLDLQFYGGQA